MLYYVTIVSSDLEIIKEIFKDRPISSNKFLNHNFRGKLTKIIFPMDLLFNPWKSWKNY